VQADVDEAQRALKPLPFVDTSSSAFVCFGDFEAVVGATFRSAPFAFVVAVFTLGTFAKGSRAVNEA